MVNVNIFNTARKVQPADTVNEAGGVAYKMSDRAALAQLAATGCISNTFYTDAKTQMKSIVKHVDAVCNSQGGGEFIAKLAVYSREKGFMKDMPVLLVSFLAVRYPELYEKVFARVVDNGKMLRNHVQIVRSGQIDGRRSMPAAMRRQIRKWFATRNNHRLFKDSVGNDPSLVDVIKMIHPKPRDAEQEALFGYLLDKKEYNREALPPLVKQYEAFKRDKSVKVPEVPFQMLDSLGLKDEHWTEIDKNARWQMTRMNLNTFMRHGVFKDDKMVRLVANRLQDAEQIKQARQFPYQLMSAFMNTTGVPHAVSDALQEATEISCNNVPVLHGNVYIFPDTSRSMRSSVTGYRTNQRGRTIKESKVRCVDAAALIASAIQRTNRHAVVIPFDTRLHDANVNPRDSIMTNARKFASCGGWGTNVSLGLNWLVQENKNVDLVIYISDYESWVDKQHRSRGSAMLQFWQKIKRRNKNAKLVCIDLTPTTTRQVPDGGDILNVGGFSDVVFDVLAQFNEHGMQGQHWVEVIDKMITID